MPELNTVEDLSDAGVIVELPDNATARPEIGARSIPGEERETGPRRREVDRRPAPREGHGKVPVDVQRRIDAATRARGDAERMADGYKRELEKARRQLAERDGASLDAESKSAQAKYDDAKKRHKKALDEGETEAATEASADMATAAATLESVRVRKASAPPVPQQGDGGGGGDGDEVHPLVRGWMDRNPWFTKNKQLHDAAVGMHHVLIARGITLKSDPDRYFEEIDREMAAKFPEIKEDRIGYEDDDGEGGGEGDDVQDLDDPPRRQARTERPQPQNQRGIVRQDSRRKDALRIRLDDTEIGVARTMGVDPQVWGINKAFREGKIDEKQKAAELNKYYARKRAQQQT